MYQSLTRVDGSGVHEILDMVNRLLDVGRALDDCIWETPVVDFWERFSKRKRHSTMEKRAFCTFRTNEGIENGFEEKTLEKKT